MRCEPGPSNRQRFKVYVLELRDGRLYVGSTALALSERLRQHRGERRVKRYRRDLSPPTMCATRERAEGIERRTAARLRARGWEVEQG
jgi:predicted GIY-YIG superfamily endonuclease